MEQELLLIINGMIEKISVDDIKTEDREKLEVNKNKDGSLSCKVFKNILIKVSPQKEKYCIELRKINDVDISLLNTKFVDVRYKEKDLYVKVYVRNIEEISRIENELISVYKYLYLNEPVEQFSCCSRYVECSDALKCIHPNPRFAKGCQYQNNLLQNKIFFRQK